MKQLLSSHRIAALAIALFLVTATASRAAVDMFLQIKDEKGKEMKVPVNGDGSFKSPALKAGTYSWSWGVSQHSGSSSGSGSGRVSKIEAIVVKHQLAAPRDAASGQATGKRQHKPMTIRKEYDKASPMLGKLGTFTVDEDCDGISGTVQLIDDGKKTISPGMWDLGVQKKL